MLISRYCIGSPISSRSPGTEFRSLTKTLNGQYYDIIIFDTPTQPHVNPISPTSLGRSRGIVLIYNLNDQRSFDALEKRWIPFISGGKAGANPNQTKFILLGIETNPDKPRVEQDLVALLVEKYNFSYFVIELSTNTVLEEAIDRLILGDVNHVDLRVEKPDITGQYDQHIDVDYETSMDSPRGDEEKETDHRHHSKSTIKNHCAIQ